MHNFLKAIGFSNIHNKGQLDELVAKVLEQPKEKLYTKVDADTMLVQVNRDFGMDIGVSVVGELDENNYLNVIFAFPYLKNIQAVEQEEIQIERHAEKPSYVGVAEDLNVGVSLIFYVQNIVEYVKRKVSTEHFMLPVKVCLAGLSDQATILLEINKNEKQAAIEKEGNQTRNSLLAAARAGDMDAIENLTLEDMDTYTIISRRAKKEDILTIVDSYFMPFGVESDQYSILGNIQEVSQIQNDLTGENVYILVIECNNLTFRVGINQKNLIGEPAVGRRFKGVIWMQGEPIFES